VTETVLRGQVAVDLGGPDYSSPYLLARLWVEPKQRAAIAEGQEQVAPIVSHDGLCVREPHGRVLK